MREILFRGKRLDNGEWVEGAFLNDRDGSFYICPAVSDITYGDNGNRRRIGCWYTVDPDTVGQFTGLYDKNGKRIFEGDIVKGLFWQGISVLGVVEFRDGAFGLRWLRGKVEEFSAFTSICNVEYEVLGNIHDNPELLTE